MPGNAEARSGRDRAQAVDDEIAGVDAQRKRQAAGHHDGAAQPEPAALAEPGKGYPATTEALMTEKSHSFPAKSGSSPPLSEQEVLRWSVTP